MSPSIQIIFFFFQLFEIASQKLSPMLPELAWKSCVLCTTKLNELNEFCVLDEFEASRKLISEGSLSKLIQSCLEGKVGAHFTTRVKIFTVSLNLTLVIILGILKCIMMLTIRLKLSVYCVPQNYTNIN